MIFLNISYEIFSGKIIHVINACPLIKDSSECL